MSGRIERQRSCIHHRRRGASAGLVPAVLLAATVALAAQEGTAPRGPYFGQSPPGTTPSVFAPGIVSLPDRYEYVIAFSPDGSECCFGVTDSKWSTSDLYCAKQEKGVWSTPAKAAFQQGPDGWLPFFTPDGKAFLFSSGRPMMKDPNSYRCDRKPGGWGKPRKLAPPLNSKSSDWRPTLTSAGTLYFTSDRDGEEGAFDIYRASPRDGKYATVENLGPPVNSPYLDASPCPSPDEQFLTIESWRPGGYGQGDLYISYRKNDGTWTSPQNLGPSINTEQIEDGGSLSPDGKYFFFNRRKAWETDEQTDIHWVDIRALFKPYVLHPADDVDATVGRRLEVRLPADEFADHDDHALKYAASSAGGGPLPPWLVYDAEARSLRGTPDAPGPVEIEITATDPLGSSCADALTISVAP